MYSICLGCIFQIVLNHSVRFLACDLLRKFQLSLNILLETVLQNQRLKLMAFWHTFFSKVIVINLS